MKKIFVLLALIILAMFSSVSMARADEPVDSVYDWCPNLDWAYSPLDAYQQTGDLYVQKWSNRYNAYICVIER